MSTRKSILYGFIAVVMLCAAALVYARHKENEDKLPSPFIQAADRAVVRETGRDTKVKHIGDIEVTPTMTPEQQAAALNAQGDPLTRNQQRVTGGTMDDGGIALPPGGIQVAGPTATPAELGYSPQAAYDAQQYNNQMQYAPQYDQYGQQVVEGQGTQGYVYDPNYGYGYGYGYGPVTNYGQAPINGQAYANPGNAPNNPGRPGDAYQQAQNFGPAANAAQGPGNRPAAVQGQPPVQATPNGGAANSAPAPGAAAVPPVNAQTPPGQNVPPPVPQTPPPPGPRY